MSYLSQVSDTLLPLKGIYYDKDNLSQEYLHH